jgi:DNA-binding transcriptional regulator YiaG
MAKRENDDKKATRIINILNTLNMPRIEVAEYLGVSERTLYRWMSGDTRIPRMAFIALELLLKREV